MDNHFSVGSDDGDLPWSDNRSMDSMGSDDGHSTPPEWMEQLPPVCMSAAVPINIPHPHTGQLSPVSTEMGAYNRSYATTGASCLSHPSMMAHSASSSSTGSWNMDYMDSDEVAGLGSAGLDAEYQWEQGSDDVLTIPKLELLDEDEVRLGDLEEAPATLGELAADGVDGAPLKVKRPRGRPRKHPFTPLVAPNKITKGRSKTGCLTCRKRKKKCDEAKPRCMNCEKNSVFCEGYPEKQVWKSGRERAEEERLEMESLPVITMQPIFHGLETTEDRIFWKHYNEHLSSVLTVEGEHQNAFKDMIIPIAVKHQGLMHSILWLSSKHIDFDTPYGMSVLRNNPSTTVKLLQERSEFHGDSASNKIQENLGRQVEKSSPEYKDVLFGRYGQMLCYILELVVEGNPQPHHRLHLKAYQSMIHEFPPEDPAFLAFIAEFLQYHIFADELVRFHDESTPRLASELWTAPIPIHSPRLLGVADGLFNLMSQITTLRNTIRTNTEHHIDPVVDYTSLYQADGIYAAIQDWGPRFPAGDSRGMVTPLYKQMMWIYLFRTVYPPSASPSSSSSSSPLHSAPCSGGLPHGVIDTPPLSVKSSCLSSPTLLAGACQATEAPLYLPGPGTAHLLRQDSRRHNGGRASSPDPIRQPPNHDPRITVAVEESLSILDSFKPSDPSQTLLLIPCLIIGSACFSTSQQDRVRAAIRAVRGYTGLRHTDRVAEVLEEVWRLMEVGDWVAVWDFQRVAKGLRIECLI